jgi:catechol 2,3-dioxygenase-like lactoylglutathione lyase family enzyme
MESTVLADSKAFSGFAVDDIPAAKKFYVETLGLRVNEEHGMLVLLIASDTFVLVYPKPVHVPAGFTVLNFPVEDIDRTVDELTGRGVRFERYEGMESDKKGIHRNLPGPMVAWFTDPAGNVMSVMQDR